MGRFQVTIEIGDPQGDRFEEIDVLVDTGATLTSAPASMLRGLGVIPTRTGTFEFADGRQAQLDIGDMRVRVQGAEISTSIMFAEEGSTPLLGAMTFEGLLPGVDRFNRRLVPITGKLMPAHRPGARQGAARR